MVKKADYAEVRKMYFEMENKYNLCHAELVKTIDDYRAKCRKLNTKDDEIISLKRELRNSEEELAFVTGLRDSFYNELQRERSKANAYRDALRIVAGGGE